MLTFILLFSLLLCAACMVLLLRNSLVGSAHQRRIAEIHLRNTTAIDNGTFTDDMLAEYERLPNYDGHLFDVRKWTYRQFFPQELS